MFVSRSPISAAGADLDDVLDMVEVGGVVSLDELISRASFEDVTVDQLPWPLRRNTGRSSIVANEVVTVRDPIDEGQRHLKAVSGHGEPFQFEARLDDGAGSRWTFPAFVTGYSTLFPKAGADIDEVAETVFELDVIGPIIEINDL
jgi:hypothetical protein